MAQALESQSCPGIRAILLSLVILSPLQPGSPGLLTGVGAGGNWAQSWPGQSVGAVIGLMASGLVASGWGSPGPLWAHLREASSLVKYPQLQSVTPHFVSCA